MSLCSLISCIKFNLFHAALFTLMQLLEICVGQFHARRKWNLRVLSRQLLRIVSLLQDMPKLMMLSEYFLCFSSHCSSLCELLFTYSTLVDIILGTRWSKLFIFFPRIYTPGILLITLSWFGRSADKLFREAKYKLENLNGIIYSNIIHAHWLVLTINRSIDILNVMKESVCCENIFCAIWLPL